MKRLGINIDHIATIRNARGSTHPDPLLAAKRVVNSGASSVTIHLREDRRHIRDNDVFKICKEKKIQVNLEISLNSKILKKTRLKKLGRVNIFFVQDYTTTSIKN